MFLQHHKNASETDDDRILKCPHNTESKVFAAHTEQMSLIKLKFSLRVEKSQITEEALLTFDTTSHCIDWGCKTKYFPVNKRTVNKK